MKRVQKIDEKDGGDSVRLTATPHSHANMMGCFLNQLCSLKCLETISPGSSGTQIVKYHLVFKKSDQLSFSPHTMGCVAGNGNNLPQGSSDKAS